MDEQETVEAIKAAFATNPVHQALEAAEESVRRALVRAAAQTETAMKVLRAGAVLARARTILSECDPLLASTLTLNSIRAQLVAMKEQLDAYEQNGDTGHLSNVEGHCDDVLNFAMRLQLIHATSDVRPLSAAIVELTAAAADRYQALRVISDGLEGDHNLLRSQFAALQTEVTSQRGRLDAAISQVQAQANAAEAERGVQFTKSETARIETALVSEETRRSAFGVLSDERRAALDATIAAAQGRFDTLENELAKNDKQRAADYEAGLTKTRADFEAAVVEGRNSFQAAASLVREQSDESLAAIEAKRAEAEKIVHVIGNTGLVGGYQKTANEERVAMWIWQTLAFLGMAGLVGAAVTVALHFEHVTWAGVAGRFFVATSFAAFAAYAGRQAAVHRDGMRRNRRMELELASIDPFVARMPEERQLAIKAALAEKWFGQIEPTLASEDKNSTTSAVEAIKVIAETGKTVMETATRTKGG